MQNPIKFKPIKSIASVDDFRAYVTELGIDLQCDDDVSGGGESALMKPFEVHGRTVGNRWACHPMEGWDGTADGHATEPMIRRWRRFGESGAKLIWGGEAMAVRFDGRANPHQLIINDETETDLVTLRGAVTNAHAERFGNTDDLLIGFQLTHSGRFCRPGPGSDLKPWIAYRHPILDAKFGIDSDDPIISDDEVKRLIEQFVGAAKIAHRVGVDFVDVKHCHGYLLHEFLSAKTRPGPYGGSFENRTRILREIVDGIRTEVPGMLIGVRLSAFDSIPYKPDPAQTRGAVLGPGVPEDAAGVMPYVYGFGVDENDPTQADFTETVQFLELCRELDIRLVNLTAGSPYYNPHIQRPASNPPSDGYRPPEDPLVGCARQINAAKTLKEQFPDLVMVGTAYSYLQEYLPHIAQHYVRTGGVDVVGLGRMLLPYPGILADAVEGRPLDTRLICRTLSDCTTAPRNGLPSGCYPLDEYYGAMDEAGQLKQIKRDHAKAMRHDDED
jgi:NADPH2 dehydrogenase